MSLPSTELIVHFLRTQIAQHRGAARLDRGGVCLAITRDSDGLTELWSLLITPNEVSLKRGAIAVQYKGPVVTLFLSDADLEAITKGRAPADLDAEGDARLLEQIATCFKPTTDLIGARRT